MEPALPRLRVSPLERGFHSLPPPSLGLSACEKVRPAALGAWGAPRPALQPWAAFPPGAAGREALDGERGPQTVRGVPDGAPSVFSVWRLLLFLNCFAQTMYTSSRSPILSV